MAWHFLPIGDPVLQWRWQFADDDTGSVLKQSDNSFKTLYDCVEDARCHGYAKESANRGS
jgi:hypothetical protein